MMGRKPWRVRQAAAITALALLAVLPAETRGAASRPPPPPPPADGPVLAEPADGAISVGALPHFSWQDTALYPFPGDHEIQIARDDRFADLADEDTIPALINFYVPARELAPGDYWWRVRYVPPGGPAGSWSLPRRLQIKSFTAEETLTVPAGATWEQIGEIFGRALAAAAEKPADNPGVLVRFTPGDYRLDAPDENAALLTVPAGGGGVVVDGQGAKLVIRAHGTRNTSFFSVQGPNPGGIQIRNCAVDFTPCSLTTVAGEVRELSPRTGSFRVALLPAYAASLEPVAGETKGFFIQRGTYQRIIDATWANTEESWEAAREDGGDMFRFTTGRSNLRDVAEGDYFVSYRVGGGDLFLSDDLAEDVTFNHNTFLAARNRFGNISRRARVIGNQFLRGEGRVLCAPKGGFGTLGAQHTWVEGNTMQSTRDDMYHLLHGYGVLRHNTLESPQRNAVWVHGERVLVEGNTIRHSGTGGIQIGGKGITTKRLGDGEMLLTSTEYRGMHGLIVRGNTIISPRDRGIHTRSPDAGVFAGIRFKGIVEPQYEGYQFSELVIEDNTITGHQRFEGIYVHALNVSITGNRIGEGTMRDFAPGSDAGREAGIYVDRSRNVVVADNTISDARIPADRRIIVRESPGTMVDGVTVTDPPGSLLDYTSLPQEGLLAWYPLEAVEDGGSVQSDRVRSAVASLQGTWAWGGGVAGQSLSGQKFHPDQQSWAPAAPSGDALVLRSGGAWFDAEVEEAPGELSVSLYFRADRSNLRGEEVLFEAWGADGGPPCLRLFRSGRELLASARDGAQERTVRVPFYYDHYWHHVAVVLADGALKLFVNGYLEGEATGMPAISSPPGSFRFGAGRGLEGEAAGFFEGLLDDVRIYRGSLSTPATAP